jgi:hypothetical protein
VAALANEVRDYPVRLPLLKGFERQGEQFAPAQAAANQHREYRVIAELSERRGSVVVEQAPALFGGEPVPRAHAPSDGRLSRDECQPRAQD